MSPAPVGHAATRPQPGPRFSALEYRDPSPAAWLIHLLGVVNRAAFMPGVLKLRAFHLPAADLARLRSAIHPASVAFIGPNHPEFLTDWMIDKELSRRVSPMMAHWASYEIVNASPLVRAFWLRNNLIANVPGGGGKNYSVAWARRGHGVLLHPEGTATWQGERVAPLLPGLVDMAWAAARQLRADSDRRAVWLIPIVWRLTFRADATRGLMRDMACLEDGLGLPSGRRLALAERFAVLLSRLLHRQCEQLGLASPGLAADRLGRDYFAAQAGVIAQLRSALGERYGELEADLTRAQFRLRKIMRERGATDPDGVRADRARLMELQRLAGFDPALYDRRELAQERIAEVLKRTRSALLVRGLRNALHNIVPVAAGSRTVHVRAAEPIAVHTALVEGSAEAEAAARGSLLAEHRARLQSALDGLGQEIAAVSGARAQPNPLWSGGSPS